MTVCLKKIHCEFNKLMPTKFPTSISDRWWVKVGLYFIITYTFNTYTKVYVLKT